MIGSHCGKRVIFRSDNRVYFKVKCAVCGKVFKQRKRKSKFVQEILATLAK